MLLLFLLMLNLAVYVVVMRFLKMLVLFVLRYMLVRCKKGLIININ